MVFAEQVFAFYYLAPALHVLALAIVRPRGGVLAEHLCLGGRFGREGAELGGSERDLGRRRLIIDEGLGAGGVVGGVLGLGEGEGGAKDV